MKFLGTIKTKPRLIGSFLVVALLIVIVGVISLMGMQNINKEMTSIYKDRTVPIQELAKMDSALMSYCGDLMKFMLIPDQRAAIKKTMESEKGIIQQNLSMFRSSSNLTKEEQALVVAFESDVNDFYVAVNAIEQNIAEGNDDEAIKSISDGGEAAVSRISASENLQKLISLNDQFAKNAKQSGDATYKNSLWLLIGFLVICIALSVTLGFIIASDITLPLSIATNSARKVSLGDLIRDMDAKKRELVISRKDEIGDLGRNIIAMIKYLQEIGVITESIARNDLTVGVTLRSEKDEIGQSLTTMLESLRQSIGEITDNANNLSAAAGQLAEAADQAGQATNQINLTIQQVARGTSDQADGVNKTASAADQMTKAIEGVARGAQEQSRAIERAAEITSQMNAAILQLSSNIKTVSEESKNSEKAAQSGVTTVEETLRGMQNIKARVGVSTEKVQEMGQRSGEIGAIVETIEDIASQTNLLALNAAIEAARAGEHGKGFAVVADEVRKLAERSSQATKEIANLISSIQLTVSDAVKAMDESTREVEAGVASANKAGTALSDILEAAQTVNKLAEQAGAAADEMNKASSELVASVDSVSAVVEENTAATEQMTANASEVSQAIESIASVSEENSAAIEEVSASTEEMSAQVEEVTASAQSLAELAKSLQGIANRFKLSDNLES
ncbi:MAG: methyl-accepting chemotaxis protein [Chloroflexi bacterium]|nr:methyl-accepting chemotaxis protein [Chloroflexota bacterium]